MPWVRLAQPQDVADVARLMMAFRDHLRLGEPSDAEMRAGVERLLDDPATEFLLGSAGDDAPAAGVIQLRFRDAVWGPGGDCLLEDLYVDESARGAGLGHALVAAALDRARARGCWRIELDVNESNEAAQRLYGSFGFSATANTYGVRDLYMRLHID